MGELTSTLGGRIVDSGLAASLITLITALAMVTTRQPSRRRAVARAGVLGALLSIPLVCLRPFEPFELISFVWVGLKPGLVWLGDRLGTGDLSQWRFTLGRTSFAIRYLPITLLGIYLVGVLLGVGRFVLGWWGAGWIQRNSQDVTPFTLEIYNNLPFVKGRPRPRLRVSTRTRRPVLLGTFRETILIPPTLDSPGAADALRLSLLHELAHAQASDPWFGLASELASVFWFPLPPLWWIRRQMRLDQEYLADRQAASQFGAASQYAASLVNLAASPSSGTQPLSARPTKNKSATALLPRVLMLIRAPFPLEGNPPAWWSVVLASTTVGLLLGATALTLHISLAAPTTREIHSFGMPSLILDGSPMSKSETVLPIRLPADFHFTFSVHATRSELSQITVLGVALESERLVNHTSLLPEERRWHKVRLDRAGGKLALAVNNEKPKSPPNASLEASLSMHSITQRRMTFRSLLLTW